ncbi:MAG TPA: hypothetical protein DCM86_12415 [Verrucomicrobiales bacterium]|nr:hypothetical protein [Verrucomicrobiales bacterium]
MTQRLLATLAALILLASPAPLLGDGKADNNPETVRRQPPPGKPIDPDSRVELERGITELGHEIEALRVELKDRPALLGLLPDVEIFHKGVSWALRYDEIYNPTNDVVTGRDLLRQGLERARNLREGRSPWTTATGLVLRGYISRLDGSLQPYGLVVPSSYQAGSAVRHRLDFWFHGRGEQLTELSFLRDRLRSPGEFTPRDAFVLHPYGRYCNGQKLAGEVDALEALEHVQKSYPIDENRIVVRGFSLGGAACWHLAVHHAGRWAAAAPGAGFSETPAFLKVFQNEELKPSWFEQKLWHLYDCPDYAVNLAQCPTVAYSGEVDSQKQAADVMQAALAAEGIEMVHVIGAKAAHFYTPDARAEINRRIDAIVARGRDVLPRRVHFATWTLRYNEMAWVQVDGLEQHWSRARVDAEITRTSGVSATTTNVSAVTFAMGPGLCPFDLTRVPTVTLDGFELPAPRPLSDRSWIARFEKVAGRWEPAGKADGLRKRHGLQGPIDDAFLDSFLMVKPSGEAWHPRTGAWAAAEMQHAVEHWRRHFRGDARVKGDGEVSDADIAAHNLVLWGDPSSNKLLARILPMLPVTWTRDEVSLGTEKFPAATHVPVLIFPNPLNPRRYVVLNSGFTFREYDYLNNARQVPKLPDYAIIDVEKPVTSRFPGGIAAAGFFDEAWHPARP